MRYKSKILALALAVLMVVVLFAGCSGNKEPQETSAGTTAVISTTTEAPKDFEGYEFTFSNGNYYPKVDANGLPNSALDAEWLELYEDLEQKLNIKIAYKPIDNNDDTLTTLVSAAMAGNKLVDLLWCRQDCYWQAAKKGIILPVDGDELVNLGLDCTDEDRWFQPCTNESEAFGHKWGVNCASKFVPVTTGYFVMFNKKIIYNDTNYTDLYKLVRENKWTWDVYLEIAQACTKDLDGDGNIDQWGTGATAWGNEVTTNDIDFVGPDSTGKWVFLINSQKGIDALNFLLKENTTGRLDESSGTCRQAFADGKIAFNWGNMGHITPTSPIYNSNHDYGIIPMPVGPEAKGYVASHDDNDIFVIQSTNKDLDKVVPIMNEWSLIVNNRETYLDVLDDGRCRTEEDKEMMKTYIIPNFNLTHFEVNDEITNVLDEQLISAISYGGYTVQQALEAFAPQVQGLLDQFFNN